jgi:hypothetical protein
MSDGKIEKPQPKPVEKATLLARKIADYQGEPIEGRRGMSAIHAHKEQYIRGVEYRFSDGEHGVPPLATIAEDRGKPVREYVGREQASRVMRKADGAPTAPSIPTTTGSPLPSNVKAKMEPKLGADLSSVKIHIGGDSAKAATEFGARAFTVGADVHFGAGQFAPGTKEGDRLIAHELTHVVQAKKSGVQRKADDDSDEHAASGLEVSKPEDPAEKEADEVSDHVANDLHADDAQDHGPDDANDAAGEAAKPSAGSKKKAGGEPTATAAPKEAAPPVGRKAISATASPNVVHLAGGPTATSGGPRPANTAAGGAAPPSGQQPAPVPQKPQVTFDSITLQPPMAGGNERLQVRPTAPGADGKAELWVANQKGSKRFQDIRNGPIATARNQSGLLATNDAIMKIEAIASAVEGVTVQKGKVDEDKMPFLRSKGEEAAGVVSAFGAKLRINSLEGANHKRKATNQQRVEFDKPDPTKWKKPYINKFIAEMVSQLQRQEAGMNDLSLDDWIVNRETFSPTQFLNTIHDSAKQEVLTKLKERCTEGLPRAQARLTKLQAKKSEMDAALQALQGSASATPDAMKAAMKKAKEAAKDVKEVEAEIQGYIDALPEIATGQAGGSVDPTKLQGPGGREDGQSAWADKHRKAKEALVRLVQKNDPLVAEWVGIVKETGDLAVLHDPDQIAGGQGDIDPLPVVKEPTDPNDTDGHKEWRDYLAKVKSHLGVLDINSSLGSQWKDRITNLYNSVTQDPDNPQEAYAIRTMNVKLVPKG